MVTTVPAPAIESLSLNRHIEIAASIDIVWESVLEELGPGGEMPDGTPFPMKLEPWPGGRWFRDLGQATVQGAAYASGHFWGHVQVIKPPTLLEICGPMFMSYAAISHIQYRLSAQGLSAQGETTRVTIAHRAIGQIPAEHREGVNQGWEHGLKRIREIAERRKQSPR